MGSRGKSSTVIGAYRITWDFRDVYTREETLVHYAKMVVDREMLEITDKAIFRFRMLNDFNAIGVYPPNHKSSMRVCKNLAKGS